MQITPTGVHAEINQPLAAPNLPASVLRNMPEELWEWQESVSVFWSRLCTGTALSKALPVGSDCDPSTESSISRTGSSKCGDALLCSASPNRDRTQLGFPLTTILHLWHFGERKTVS